MDKEQFISVVAAHRNLLYKICRTYCADAEARRDLEQEILLQLWHALPKFDGRVKLSTWVYRVALNTAIGFYRKDSRRAKRNVRLDGAVIALADDGNPEPDERLALLHGFIDGLNELDKALMLLYLDDNKYRDMADILGISETNVATKINRIKKSLREKFSHL